MTVHAMLFTRIDLFEWIGTGASAQQLADKAFPNGLPFPLEHFAQALWQAALKEEVLYLGTVAYSGGKTVHDFWYVLSPTGTAELARLKSTKNSERRDLH